MSSQTDHPEPGTEYPFSISDIAYATARALSAGWLADSGSWGVTGYLELPGVHTTVFKIGVDEDSDLYIEYTRYEDDAFPDSPQLPDRVKYYDAGVYLDEARADEGLEELAERCAAAIRAVTGRDLRTNETPQG
ncbi:hypothetical protein [Streptomyces sp. NPDC050145]|uniref:hypothetical protein n=1 Tax=Streptomyces sp. NPDC050145 TaxID=3365602 RepID=UPI0037A22C94